MAAVIARSRRMPERRRSWRRAHLRVLMCGDVHACSACARAAQWEPALAILAGMQGRGVQPDVVSYSPAHFLPPQKKSRHSFESKAGVGEHARNSLT